MLMLKDYFKKSYDRTSNPEETFKTIRQRVQYDDKFLMIAYMEHGIPTGFLAGDMVGEVARILIGYLPPKLSPKEKESIIDRGMQIFEDWAQKMGAVGGVFYTYRTPGAHRFMVKRGWEHDMSIYKKEYNHGKQ